MISPVGISWIFSSIIVPLLSSFPVHSLKVILSPAFCCVFLFHFVGSVSGKMSPSGMLPNSLGQAERRMCPEDHPKRFLKSINVAVVELPPTRTRKETPYFKAFNSYLTKESAYELLRRDLGLGCYLPQSGVTVRPASPRCNQRMLPLWLRDHGEDMECCLAQDGCHMQRICAFCLVCAWEDKSVEKHVHVLSECFIF